jgi:Uncharacterized conserved protein (COG2071)
MLPVLKGLIARRVLLNFRADPRIVQKLLPRSFVVQAHRGYAVVGVCLIRLEQLRPKGLPAQVGLASENMAHRVAVLYPANGAMQPGVFIWRRATDQKLVQLFGGRLFPGVHDAAQFFAQEDERGISMDVTTDDGRPQVSFAASVSQTWQSTSVFKTLDEASEFFRQGDCGFSRSRKGNSVEGMQLRTLQWSLTALTVHRGMSSFYSDTSRFPQGSVEFDCGLIMRAVPHEWHEIKEVPRLQAPSSR